ncbi:TRAP transporter small permease [Chloroflexota bacterium]
MSEQRNTTRDQEINTKRRSPLLTFERGIRAIETGLTYFGMVILAGLALTVSIHVTARYVFNSPLFGYFDFMEMMMVTMVFVTVAYCQREGGHIRVEIFMDTVLKGKRLYHIVEVFFLLLSLMAYLIITYYTSLDFIDAYVSQAVTLTIYFPIWPAKIWVPIGSTLLCIRFLLQLKHHVAAAIGGQVETLHREIAYMED